MPALAGAPGLSRKALSTFRPSQVRWPIARHSLDPVRSRLCPWQPERDSCVVTSLFHFPRAVGQDVLSPTYGRFAPQPGHWPLLATTHHGAITLYNAYNVFTLLIAYRTPHAGDGWGLKAVERAQWAGKGGCGIFVHQPTNISSAECVGGTFGRQPARRHTLLPGNGEPSEEQHQSVNGGGWEAGLARP